MVLAKKPDIFGLFGFNYPTIKYKNFAIV